MPANQKLAQRISDLQIRLLEAEETLNAIRSGAVDALVVRTPRGEQLFTLKGADQTYRVLVETMNEGAVTLKNGIISYCNSRFATMVGRPMEKVFGTSIFELVRSEEFRRLVRRVQKDLETKCSIEAELVAADGRRVPVLLSANRFHSEGHTMVGLVVTDIAGQKEVERAREELSRNALDAQEQERQRVARDLHDSVNQLLSSAQYRLKSSLFGNDSTTAGLVHSIRELIDKAIAEVRLISRNLRPGELDDLGLVAALRSLAHDFQKRTGITAKLKSTMNNCPSPVPKEIELTIYRIAQEALTNVEKHARARRVEVALTCTRSHAQLQIRDNGKGLVVRRGMGGSKMGHGLQNMNERSRLLGGSFEVKSLPKKGTHITVRLPFKTTVRPARRTT